MEQTITGERPSEILANASATGFSVSERQLKRWHFEGLIPKPAQSWPEGVSGSETIYPIGTSNQVIALCEVSQKYHRLKDIGWQLWWFGFSVDQKYWKSVLNDRAVWLDKYILKFIKAVKRENKTANRFTKWRTARTRNFLFRQLRKRLGPYNFDGFINLIVSILDGTFDGWNAGATSDDPDLFRDKVMVDKALGLHRQKQNKPQTKSKSQNYDDVEAVLVMLSARLGGICVTDLLRGSSDDLLISTRNEMRALFALVANLSKTDIAAKNGLSLTVFAKFADFAAWRTHQTMLLFLLALKEDSAFWGNLSRFLGAMRESAIAAVSREQLAALRARDPAIVGFVHPHQTK